MFRHSDQYDRQLTRACLVQIHCFGLMSLDHSQSQSLYGGHQGQSLSLTMLSSWFDTDLTHISKTNLTDWCFKLKKWPGQNNN